jgi:hypothetical protein
VAEGAHEEDEEQLVQSGEGVARVHPRARYRPGDRARFSVDVDVMHFFDPDSGESITDGQRAVPAMAGAAAGTTSPRGSARTVGSPGATSST